MINLVSLKLSGQKKRKERKELCHFSLTLALILQWPHIRVWAPFTDKCVEHNMFRGKLSTYLQSVTTGTLQMYDQLTELHTASHSKVVPVSTTKHCRALGPPLLGACLDIPRPWMFTEYSKHRMSAISTHHENLRVSKQNSKAYGFIVLRKTDYCYNLRIEIVAGPQSPAGPPLFLY